MNDMFRGVLLVLLAAMISSISQVMLKKSSGKAYPSKVREYLNLLVIGGYILLLGTTFITISAMRRLPLSFVLALEASGQVFVPVLSSIFLKEPITMRKYVGMGTIIAGILIFSL